MTNVAGRVVDVPLSFLPPGRYSATLWQDGKAAGEVVKTLRSVGAADRLSLKLAPSGGAVVKIVPVQ